MKEEIKLFVFVLCILYILLFIVEFALRLVEEDPKPLTLTKWEQISYLASLSYIITYFLI